MAGTGNVTGRIVRALMVAVVASAAAGGCGVTAPHGHPGFADLDTPGWSDTDREISLSFGRSLLGFAAMACEGDEPETAAMLRGLAGVRVRVYRITGDAVRVADRLDRTRADLEADDWLPVSVVRRDGERVHVLMRTHGEDITGLVVMASDGDEEVVFVNVMGELRPDMFNDMTLALDIDAPEVEVTDDAS